MAENTKYVIIVPDGAADEPLEVLGGKTVLESADIPNIDRISSEGRQGIVYNIPEGMAAGSDVAMMSLLGYDPQRFYTGRAPIEAVAQGIEMGENDWAFRCNLVTMADEKMADHSAGHISTEEGAKLIKDLNDAFANQSVRFYPGISYRHLMLVKGMEFNIETQPPHDIIGQAVVNNLPRGIGDKFLIDLMARSQQLFANHEVNKVRKDLGENTVSSIWLWGEGTKAKMESFEKRFGIKGAAITAVDLIRGLSKLIDFDLIAVPGATGFIDTNFAGKGIAAIEALEKYDIVFVHVEAPDEAGHSGNAEMKKKAVEQIDKFIVGPVYDALQKYENRRILVLPDHPTPVATRAHSPEPVPFAMAGSGVSGILHKSFSEANAAESGFKIENGCELMEYFLKS